MYCMKCMDTNMTKAQPLPSHYLQSYGGYREVNEINGIIITAELWIVGNGNLEEWSLGGILNIKSARVKLSEISRKCPKKKERKGRILGTGALFAKAECRECLEKGLTMSREWWEVQWRRRSQGWHLAFWVRKTFGWRVHLLIIETKGEELFQYFWAGDGCW